MLFNKSTGKSDTDIRSLDSLIAWLEQQPANGTYNYCSSEGCLLQQYFTAMGLKNVHVTPDYYRATELWSTKAYCLPEGWGHIALGNGVRRQTGWTFGVALERAKALREERVQ